MEQTEQIYLPPSFNEDEWLKLIFLLSDTQHWLNGMITNAIYAVPIKERKKLMRRSYRLSIISLAHIMERHLSKIPRHPSVGKFQISAPQILAYIRDAFNLPQTSVPGCTLLKRELDTGNVIGYDCNQVATSLITILTDGAGRILTAFPGKMKEQTSVSNL